MSHDCPKMSAAIIALVLMEIFFNIELGHILKVSGSISANTGIAFQCKMEVTVAHIVNGVTITHHPGSKPIDPAVISPEVQELTVTACLTLKYFSHALSNFCTCSPP